MNRPPLYGPGDYVWCRRCERVERVGAVLHDGPYDVWNSRYATQAEIGQALSDAPSAYDTNPASGDQRPHQPSDAAHHVKSP